MTPALLPILIAAVLPARAAEPALDLVEEAAWLGLARSGTAMSSAPDPAHPAALARLDRPRLATSVARFHGGVLAGSLSYAHPTLSAGTFAFRVTHLSAGTIERRESFDLPATAGGFTAAETDARFAYGRAASSRLGLGASFRLSRTAVDAARALAVSADAWARYEVTGSLSAVAGAAGLLPAALAATDRRNARPPTLAAGAAYDLRVAGATRVSLAVDLFAAAGATLQPRAGAEVAFADRVRLRGGARPGEWSLGGGAGIGAWTVDYALSSRALAAGHSVSVAASLGSSRAARRAVLEAARAEEIRQAVAEATTSLSRAIESASTAARKETEDRLRAEMESALSRRVEESLAKGRTEWEQAGRASAEQREAAIRSEARRERAEAERVLREELTARLRQEMEADLTRRLAEASARIEREKNAELARARAAAEARVAAARRTRPSADAPPAGRSLSDLPAEVQALYRRGMAHFLAGRYAEAIAEWQRILRTDPRNPLALQSVAEAERRLARLREAPPGGP